MKRPDKIRVGQLWNLTPCSWAGFPPHMVVKVDKDYAYLKNEDGHERKMCWAFLKHAQAFEFLGYSKEGNVNRLLQAIDEV